MGRAGLLCARLNAEQMKFLVDSSRCCISCCSNDSFELVNVTAFRTQALGGSRSVQSRIFCRCCSVIESGRAFSTATQSGSWDNSFGQEDPWSNSEVLGCACWPPLALNVGQPQKGRLPAAQNASASSVRSGCRQYARNGSLDGRIENGLDRYDKADRASKEDR
jgi:hypothetical protein